ncbi:MAG: SDR family NAD(P)-dependent oxidoreductase [Propionibacteriaceae bacterium]|jgi:short-subunit dehydrogenase|nr:SDR family NAD(P)-dependent oxidoreductase [Propionibacteriaceae bacterium]
MPTAVITGGSVGLGRAFATALAARGYDLVLAARDRASLDRAAAELRVSHGVTVEVVPTDLAERADVLALAERVGDRGRPIDLLINNAGFAVHDSLIDADVEAHARALDVMCLAVLILSRAAAESMRSRRQGSIVNVSSASAVITTGNYSAIKSWVQIYTESLAIELAGHGVKAMAVMPGWLKTEFHRRGQVKAHSLPALVWTPVDRVVREALADLDRGKVLCVPTKRWRFAVWLARVVPRRTIRWVSAKLTRSRS